MIRDLYTGGIGVGAIAQEHVYRELPLELKKISAVAPTVTIGRTKTQTLR